MTGEMISETWLYMIDVLFWKSEVTNNYVNLLQFIYFYFLTKTAMLHDNI